MYRDNVEGVVEKEITKAEANVVLALGEYCVFGSIFERPAYKTGDRVSYSKERAGYMVNRKEATRWYLVKEG